MNDFDYDTLHICGIYCAGEFWKNPDGSCDHYVDYLEQKKNGKDGK